MDTVNNEKCTCRTCGHTWERGLDGSHSCVEALLLEVQRLRAALKDSDKDAARMGASLEELLYIGLDVGQTALILARDSAAAVQKRDEARAALAAHKKRKTKAVA